MPSFLRKHPELIARGLAREIVVSLPHGLHSRPSARLAQLAQNYSSALSLVTANGEADAKSMLDLLSLAVKENTEAAVLAQGPDAEEALEEICRYLTSPPE